MSLTRKVAYNTTFQFIGKIVSTLIGVVIVGLITRHFGQAGYGQYTTALAFVQFFAVIVDLGLYLTLIQEISNPAVDEHKAIGNVFTIRLISALVFFVLAPLIALFFPYAPIVKQGIVLMSISFFFYTLAQVLIAIFQKNLRMDRIIVTEVIGRIAFLATVILTVVTNQGLLWIIFGNIVFNLIYFLIIFFLSRGYTTFHLEIDWPYWKKIWQRAWPIALTSLLTLVYFKADTVILSVFRSESEVGIYGATYKVLEIIGTFPHMFLGLVLPVLTTAYLTNNRERFKRIYQKVFDFFLIISIPLIVGASFLADRVMVLIAGPEFLVSGAVLKILIWATAIIFFGSLFGYIILAIDKQKKMIPYYIITALLSLVLYFALIPEFSYWAAAGITVFIELLYYNFCLCN
jgi:O-antigen/teichoic acid export membrane protein